MTYYHYTNMFWLQSIIEDKLIRTSYGQLERPDFAEASTDKVKTVVWLSSVLDFDTAKDNGLDGSIFDKTECAIAITPSEDIKIEKWDIWAKRNGIDPEWEKALKQTAPNWDTWYISEQPIKIDKSVHFIIRPDVITYLMEQYEDQL